uniref:Helix-turn-helix domain-containing protein n=1 Tax=Roseihalotalea indica TaxID=2867963 RepID=A0AA49GMM2_9BACT|nr:helix-turn-helix domain-containing protein [Tunicatimonas sp. TK19036]
MKNKKNTDINPITSCHARVEKQYKRHTQFEILWFKDNLGSCCQKIDHQKHRIPNNSIFFLGKGQIHQLCSDAEGYSICFSGEFFQYGDNSKLRIIFNPFIDEPIFPDEETSEQLESILKLALKEAQTTNYQPVINSYLEAFLYKLTLLRPEIKFTQDRFHRLENLYQLIEKHYLTERKACFYADKMGLTTKRLNEILKNKVGLTVTQLLHKVITAEAKKMIAKGDKSIKEVSFELRFSEQAYFSRFFKKQTGMSPEKFAKIIQEA